MKLGCHKKTSGFNDVYGRMKWDECIANHHKWMQQSIEGALHSPR